ncbi:hypothetical protein PAMA_017693 [Pampus argenteus]
MLRSRMLYCNAAYAASTATLCPSGRELHDLHDCCISADMDSGGGGRGRKRSGRDGVTRGKGDRGGNESKGEERRGEERRGEERRGEERRGLNESFALLAPLRSRDWKDGWRVGFLFVMLSFTSPLRSAENRTEGWRGGVKREGRDDE